MASWREERKKNKKRPLNDDEKMEERNMKKIEDNWDEYKVKTKREVTFIIICSCSNLTFIQKSANLYINVTNIKIGFFESFFFIPRAYGIIN